MPDTMEDANMIEVRVTKVLPPMSPHSNTGDRHRSKP